MRFCVKITAFRDHNTRVCRTDPFPRQVMQVKKSLGQLFQTGKTAFTGIIWINDMKGSLNMMLMHEIPFLVDTGSCCALSCLIEQDGGFIGVDAPTGKLHIWSEAGNAAELELPRRYDKLVCSPNNQRYLGISRCAPGSISILDPHFRELDRIRIRTEGLDACAEDIWFEEESGLLWLVFSGAVYRFSMAGDCLGAFMTAPQGTQYQALCTHGNHLYLAYQKGGCAYASVYSRQGAHLEGTSLGREYVVRNWLSAEKSGGTSLRVFAVKGLGFPCILEFQPGTPSPSRFLSVECFSNTPQLQATCHVDGPAGQ